MDDEEKDKLKEEKLKGVKKRFDDLMADVASDVMDTEELEALHNIIRKKLTGASVPTTLPYLRAFLEGVEFGVFCAHNDHEAQGLMGVRFLVKGAEKKVKDKFA